MPAWEVRAHKGGLPSILGGANPPDERKEGDADVCYIFGSYPDRYIHRSPLQVCYIRYPRVKESSRSLLPIVNGYIKQLS